MIKYPEIEVALSGEDGNAFSIIGAVSRAMRKSGVSRDEILEYRTEALSGNYSKVISTSARWVSIS